MDRMTVAEYLATVEGLARQKEIYDSLCQQILDTHEAADVRNSDLPKFKKVRAEYTRYSRKSDDCAAIIDRLRRKAELIDA